MRKVIFGGAISLDGYFAREDGSVDWLVWSDDVQKIMAEMWPRFDVMVMGRKTWQHAQEQFSPEDLEKASRLAGEESTDLEQSRGSVLSPHPGERNRRQIQRPDRRSANRRGGDDTRPSIRLGHL